MKVPSHADRFVKVSAYLSDEGFGYDNWHARQFVSNERPHGPERPAVLIICEDKAEQADALAFLEARAASMIGQVVQK